jgi:hypothetical protein
MTWIMARNLKNMEKNKKHYLTWNMARNTEKGGKGKMHTGGPGIWQENSKSWKTRNTHGRT